ncbi:MAG: hypothetical protein U0Q18_26230 [Bryobacteraceae bacterium]
MQVALLTTFAASKKEPLAAAMERIYRGFHESGLGEPFIRFNFGDHVVSGFVSSIDRVLKRHPELERFITSAAPAPGIQGARRISNGPLSGAAGEALPFATLHKIAQGVPRSYPFRSVVYHFHSPPFGHVEAATQSANMMPGILLTDSWWVNGRNRSLTACRLVEADPGSKQLPNPPEAVAALFAACGKAKKTIQAPIGEMMAGVPTPLVRSPAGMLTPSANPEAALKAKAISVDYRTRMPEIVQRAALPHDLPASGPDAMRDAPIGVTAGPKKPVLEQAFKPLGYTCRGGSGSFVLRRRTGGNLTAELALDVGTWGHSVLAMFRVLGVGFKATLALPVTARAVVPAQYPIGSADRWQRIVENLAVLVAELDRSFVPEIEAAVGTSPEWYQPESS